MSWWTTHKKSYYSQQPLIKKLDSLVSSNKQQIRLHTDTIALINIETHQLIEPIQSTGGFSFFDRTAIVAALEILGMADHIAQVLDIDVAVPMVGQGSVAVEARSDDRATLEILSAIDHVSSRYAVETERAFLAELGAGCSLPVGAHLTKEGVFHAFMATDDCSDSVQLVGSIGDTDDNIAVGIAAAHECRTRLAEVTE